jgi:hypothetical protein
LGDTAIPLAAVPPVTKVDGLVGVNRPPDPREKPETVSVALLATYTNCPLGVTVSPRGDDPLPVENVAGAVGVKFPVVALIAKADTLAEL